MKKKNKSEKLPPLEGGISQLLTAITSQIARELQRSPHEREQEGVRKWKPIEARTEIVTMKALEVVATGQADLDALLVSSQSFVKALMVYVEELGRDGLGQVRREYCRDALEKIQRDVRCGLEVVGEGNELQ